MDTQTYITTLSTRKTALEAELAAINAAMELIQGIAAPQLEALAQKDAELHEAQASLEDGSSQEVIAEES